MLKYTLLDSPAQGSNASQPVLARRVPKRHSPIWVEPSGSEWNGDEVPTLRV